MLAAQLMENKLFHLTLDRVEQGWFNLFQNCEVKDTASRDYYFTAMKSCQYVRKQINDILIRSKN